MIIFLNFHPYFHERPQLLTSHGDHCVYFSFRYSISNHQTRILINTFFKSLNIIFQNNILLLTSLQKNHLISLFHWFLAFQKSTNFVYH